MPAAKLLKMIPGKNNPASDMPLLLPICSLHTLPMSAGPEHSHATCYVSGKTGLEYPSLEMVTVRNHGHLSHGQSNILGSIPSAFLSLDSLYGFIQLVAIMLISALPEDDVAGETSLVIHGAIDGYDENVLNKNEDLYGTADPSPISTASIQPDPDTLSVSPRQIVKTREFWILWFTFVLNTQSVGYINSMYKAFGQTFIKDDHFLAVVGAFAAVFNSGGRVFWGQMCDVFGYKMCMLLVTTLISILYSTLYFTEFGQRATYAIWIWAIFFSFCGNFVLLPTATALCFGTKNSSKNYGLVMTGSAAAAPIIAILTQVLSPIVGFLGMFIIISFFSAAAAILTLFFPVCPSPKNILERLSRSTTSL